MEKMIFNPQHDVMGARAVTKTIRKQELLDWLRAGRDHADPPTALVYENVISVVESGALDNTRDNRVKLRFPCEHQKRSVMFTPYEETSGKSDSNVGEFIVYHDCSMHSRNVPCPYPARYCEYKAEVDQFAEYILDVVKKVS